MKAFPSPHPEEMHKSHRAPWLRAAVLGANDGIVSTSSLMLGVLAASDGNPKTVLTAGIAGLIAGALSMAAGEYVSVSSQRDSELFDIAIEKKSLRRNPEKELEELAWFYEKKGLDAHLAAQVAQQLHKRNAIAAHAQSELGIDYKILANPMQAAITSAAAFAAGAIVPVLAAVLSNRSNGAFVITFVSLGALLVSGAVSAIVGGGNKMRAALRVLIGGGIAMGITYLIGHIIGAAI